MRFLAFVRLVTGCAFMCGIVHAAALTGNKITADGTYTVSTIPGQRYVFAASGDFGSGSLAINWNNGSSVAYANSPATAAETWTFTAAATTLELILTGSTDPDLTVAVSLADSTGSAPEAADVSSAIAAFDGAQAEVARDGMELGTAATADVESLSSVPINAEFVFEGDSITANTGQPSWVPEAMLLTNFIDRGGYNIEAVSGSTLADMAARYSAQVYPHRPTSGEPVFLFLLIGANDTIASATWLTNLENYVTTAKSDGFTVVCLTPFIRSGVDHPTRYAAKLLNSQVPDRVINTASLFRDASNTAYFSDGVHLTASAAKMLAGFVDAEMGKMTLPGDSAITVNGAGIGANVKNPRAAIDAKGEFSLMIGDSNAENTAKGSRIALRPYGLETDTPPSVIGGYVDASNSRLLIGGGTNSGFAATAVEFYTAANNSTLSGSLRGKLIGAGYWIFGANSTTVPAACTIGILDPTPFLRLSASDGTTTNSAYLAVVPSNGYAATGVLSGETLLAPVSGKALAIASSATAVTAIVRMRVKPNGAINYVPIAEPSSPSEGDTYMDSTSHKLRTYDGTAWQDHW